MDFRISFSRNEWLSFIKQRSTCGTSGLGTRSFFSSIPWIIVENYMLYLILCNSQDNLPFFLLSPACFLWAVICSHLQGTFWWLPSTLLPLSLWIALILSYFFLFTFVCVCMRCLYVYMWRYLAGVVSLALSFKFWGYFSSLMKKFD